ncbi:MAG TPA: hypothetical protein VGQ57_13075 [Polyangiaceae bacterium]|nr:hypothetical protein [Polyangiaceae bacterium]
MPAGAGVLAGFTWLAVAGCDFSGHDRDPGAGARVAAPALRGRAATSGSALAAEPTTTAGAPGAAPAGDAPCEARRARLLSLPFTTPAEGTAAERAALLLQVKATPVVFLERPRPLRRDPVAREWRRRLETSELPGRVLARLLGSFKRFPVFLRDVLLTDGYVFATQAPLGATLAEGLTLGSLFREPRLVVERGAERLLVESDGEGGYRYADGPERGRAARLLLFDRVFAEGAEPAAPVHVELDGLQASLGFDTITLERVTPEGIVAEAHYGPTSVPTVLVREGAALRLGCELPGPDAERLRHFRELALRRRRAVEHLKQAIAQGVEEALPFDEPRTEFGQEDGKLRQRWREAYFQGASRYDFNGDSYEVFDAHGRPRVPEVCIDFVVDTFERAGGAWYAGKDEPRARSAGRVEFDGTGMLNRRNVEEFVALARRRTDWFDLRPAPPDEQVPIERRTRFLATLFAHRGEYRPGDIVVILGPRQDEKLHYHSFFVFDADPVTGMPSLVAGNSGRPRVRAWASEMASAPKRGVFARIRPSLSLLEQALPDAARASRPLTAQAGPLWSRTR